MAEPVADYDAIVAGGGIAGMTAAVALGGLGLRTLCIDPETPVTDRDAPGADLRTTAFLQPARAFLDRIGLWDRLAPHASPLRIMRLVDAGGDTPAPRTIREFDAAEIGSEPFGWNLPNWLLRREFAAALAASSGVTHRTGVAATGLLSRTAEARLRLSDGSQVRARLVVAADGRNSTLRRAAGIGVRTIRYAQKALAFAVTHPEPHHNVSTEVHRTGGPFTLVPLPDRDGLPCSAVVWMERGPEAERLRSLPPDAFSAAATHRSGGIQGPLTLTGGRSLWPIISQVADRLTADRLVLVAEAAHVVPPIGAQGLNMSLGDIRCLTERLAEAADPGDPAILAAHARARQPEMFLRVGGIDLLNRAAMLEPRPLRDLRRAGLAALHDAGPVRRGLMRLGLGAGWPQPARAEGQESS